MPGPDPHSYANFDAVRVTHLHLALACDFPSHTFAGWAELRWQRLQPEAAALCLDATNLAISAVLDAKGGSALEWDTTEANQFGGQLRVTLPPGAEAGTVRVEYRTSPEAEAVQWLTPQQTAGGRHPFCFTQSQAILARTLFPCHDTPAAKAPFLVEVTVPEPLTAVASGRPVGEPTVDAAAGTRTFRYEQRLPVMAYLVAVCCGSLDSAPIGPRSTLFAEPELLPAAVQEFDGVPEAFLKEAEAVCGVPYQWGTYDLLVLPRCFAYGGMENPNVTFLSASLLAGDRSLTTTVAHEIVHAWSGNWVTNARWRDFWLNEGFTRYIERRILGRLHGEAYRGLQLSVGYATLRQAVESFAATPNLTRLQPDLATCSPDDAFSRIPYEKGSLLLHRLETLVGGPEPMSAWLKDYFTAFAQQSIEADQMRRHFAAFFAARGTDVSGVDWDHWLQGEGVPQYDLLANIDLSLVTGCRQIADRWHGGGADATAEDLVGLHAHQVMLVLDNLLGDGVPLAPAVLARMDTLYRLSASRNVEVGFRWLLLNLRNANRQCLPGLWEFLGTHGRGSYVLPLYAALQAFDRPTALELFAAHRGFYQAVIVRGIARTLKLAS